MLYMWVSYITYMFSIVSGLQQLIAFELSNLKTRPWKYIRKNLKNFPGKALGMVHHPYKFEKIRLRIVQNKNLQAKLFGRYLEERLRCGAKIFTIVVSDHRDVNIH